MGAGPEIGLALVAAQCREAGAVGEDAAVYLSGDGPIAAQG
jgi:hypothetical protein